ncbi:hypothetical protein M5K25_010490 [Dendrobium thyrsiflorum]|uniref:Uncharacterized protein n=1 Tax=Dendrobium thyrsiflorum TaxID=117978 RepID=A0ABD0V0R5_DENTH
MDVPLSMPAPFPTSKAQAESMFTPGAMTSGFKMPPFSILGPLEEKKATVGDGRIPYSVPLNVIVPVAFGFVLR